jgi:hypothetical protein
MNTERQKLRRSAEFLAFDFEAKFDRSTKFPVSRTIEINRSIFRDAEKMISLA